MCEMAQGYPSEEARPTNESLYSDEQMELIDGMPANGEGVGMVESTSRMLEYEKLRIIAVRAQQIRWVLQLTMTAPLSSKSPSEDFGTSSMGSPLLIKKQEGIPFRCPVRVSSPCAARSSFGFSDLQFTQ